MIMDNDKTVAAGAPQLVVVVVVGTVDLNFPYVGVHVVVVDDSAVRTN